MNKKIITAEYRVIKYFKLLFYRIFPPYKNMRITILFAIARPNAQYGVVQSTGIIQGSRIVAPGK